MSEELENNSEEIENKENQPQENIAMDSGDFKAQLTAFFDQYRPSKVKYVDEMVEKFAGREQQVFKHLDKKYGERRKQVIDANKNGTKLTSDNLDDDPEDDVYVKPSESKAKNKKKKMMIMIIVIVVLGVIGAVGFMFKDKVFGGSGEEGAEHGDQVEHTDEHAEEETSVVEESSEESNAGDEAEMTSDSTLVDADSASAETERGEEVVEEPTEEPADEEGGH
jgi:hypothetical protein